ncbi:calponin homology domain-containing protein DDB_G0272472-like [Actinia tenebrosa]|uniref:Calponin homology domain-containing protein DDB_G0272472-like n=1 Tax=Actinia tenebrosa TaxID=6105 RepID=A0A6P8IBB9_ACTTE|nr:calponin homology domain-containing protein DDB_G0272472-like [Actinia tenebrosa]
MAAKDQDVVLKVTLNKIHRFMLVIAKESSIADLKTEITKVSRLLLSSADLGEIISVQSCDNHELPDIYKVGRLLKEGDSILAYSAGHVLNHADSILVEENAEMLKTTSQHSPQYSGSQKPTQNKSDLTDISKAVVQGNSIKETEDLAECCENEQECSSKRNEKEDIDKTNNTRKEKTLLKTQNVELASSGNAEQECANSRKEKKTVNSFDDNHDTFECRKEKSRNQTENIESISNKDGENSTEQNLETTDNIDEQESMEQCKEAEDKSSEGRSPERLMKEHNHETPLNSNEEDMMQCQENEDKDSISKSGRKRTVFQVENFISQSQEENWHIRVNCNQKEMSRPTDKTTRKRVFSTQMKSPPTSSNRQRIEKTPTVQEKIGRRKRKQSRTQSIDESLADEDQRHRSRESASTASQHSSIVSEIVLKSQAFKEMLESTGCFSQRRKQAIEKSVTKVATWLVNSDQDIDDETHSIQRMSTKLLDEPEETPANHCVIDSLDINDNDITSTPEVYHEDMGRKYPIIDVLQDRVLYFDSDPSDASTSGGLIKETYMSSCKVVIPKLNLTQPTVEGLKTSCSASQPRSVPPEVATAIETNAAERTEEEPSTAVVCVAGCQDTNEEECCHGSQEIIGSSGSEELFPASPKLKHLTSYTNETLPSNANEPLEHAGNEKGDEESCFSTEILESAEQARGEHHSPPKKLKLPPNVEGATTNETEDKNQDSQVVKKSQTSVEKILEDGIISQLENEQIICEETVEKSYGKKKATEQQNIEDAETTEDFSTVQKKHPIAEEAGLSSPKKKKKKSRETGETKVTNSIDGSFLSESGMNYTSSCENHSQKDKISKQRRIRDTVYSDDNKAEEESEQSMSKEGKKRDKRNSLKEKLAAVTSEKTKGSKRKDVNNNVNYKQLNEKQSKNSTNKKVFTQENSIQENSGKLPNIQTFIPESTASSPRKETAANTELPIQTSLVSLPIGVISNSEKKVTSPKLHKKSNSKNKDFPQETLPGGSQHVIHAVDDLVQSCSQSTVTTSEENAFEKKSKKKKKKERNKTVVSAEEVSEGKEKRKKNERNVDKETKISSFDSRESTILCVDEEENSDGKKRKKDKKKRGDKAVEDEKVDIREKDVTKKSSQTKKISREEEFEAANKPVKQVDRPVLKSLDETGKEEGKTRDKTKKEIKRREKNEKNDTNKEKEDRDEIPKKKRKKERKVCEENGKASQNGLSVPASHHDMFTSGSESEINTPVTDVLSWISKKINPQTTKKSSTKKTNKSTLLDLVQDDQELHSSKSVFTPRSSSMDSRSRIFHKTPIGFTNTVPRVSKKSNPTATTVSSSRRKRKLSNSPPQRRELTRQEKEMLSGGVKRLDELLDNDSVWD